MVTYSDRCKLVSVKGAKIFLMDFSGLDAEVVTKIIPECKKFVCSQPLNSVKTLTDITNARYSVETTEALKDLAASNKPYVSASAIVGVEGMKNIVLNSVIKFSGRSNMRVFKTREEALDWLVSI